MPLAVGICFLKHMRSMRRLPYCIFLTFFILLAVFSQASAQSDDEGPIGTQPLAVVTPNRPPEEPQAPFFDRTAIRVGAGTLFLGSATPKTLGAYLGVSLPFLGYGLAEFNTQVHYPFGLPSFSSITTLDVSLGVSIPVITNRLHLNFTGGSGYTYLASRDLSPEEVLLGLPMPETGQIPPGHYLSVHFGAAFVLRTGEVGWEISPFRLQYTFDPALPDSKFGLIAGMSLTLRVPVAKRAL